MKKEMSFQKLREMRAESGQAQTTGLDETIVEQFWQDDKKLQEAIDEAHTLFQRLKTSHPELIQKKESDLIEYLQEDLVNFYAASTINPYVAIAARGPWIVTLYGAVIHDSGGYGMLGFGHGPREILATLSQNHVMANVMTASLEQKELTQRLRKEIGHLRETPHKNPYNKFLCLNSGSEAVTMATRISDINAKMQTDPEGKYTGQPIKILSLQGSFHGRTDRPAQASDSTMKACSQLASFRDRQNLLTIPPNNCEALANVFKRAEDEKFFIEMMLVEPVMGEGDPGKAMTPEFYRLARKLTKEHGSLLLVDSIQAGLRAHGVLSVIDYPGFEKMPPPDMETFSKAINAGQFPLSVLAMSHQASKLYQIGIYGNTMTTNPRALAVACSVLDLCTTEIRQNIREKGKEFLLCFNKLAIQFPEIIEKVQGTGLLFAVSLRRNGFAVIGENGLEQYLRKQGIGVIHGGKNALRFTPHFRITSKEIEMIASCLTRALERGPIYGDA